MELAKSLQFWSVTRESLEERSRLLTRTPWHSNRARCQRAALHPDFNTEDGNLPASLFRPASGSAKVDSPRSACDFPYTVACQMAIAIASRLRRVDGAPKKSVILPHALPTFEPGIRHAYVVISSPHALLWIAGG